MAEVGSDSGPVSGEQIEQSVAGTPLQPERHSPPIFGQLRPQKVTSQPQWDNLLLSSPEATLLQSWRWGEFKREAGWSPLRLVIAGSQITANGAVGKPPISAQILFRKLPRLPVPVAIAYIPRGPVNVRVEGDPRASEAFWDAVHASARKRGSIFLKVEPQIPLCETMTKADVDAAMSSLGFKPSGRLQPARTMVLDLDKSEDDLLKAMKPKTRYNLRLAERRGVQVRQAATLQDLQAFYSLLEVTSQRDEFGVHTFSYYEQLWKVFGPGGDNNALLLLAEHPDEAERAQGPVAGLLALRFGTEAIYMYGASADRGREHMPNYLLQWQAMKWAKEHGCTTYDFWGIPDAPSEEGVEGEVSPINTRAGLRGVYWFKKGFGGREVEYPGAYDYIYNPLLYKVWMRWRGANLG